MQRVSLKTAIVVYAIVLLASLVFFLAAPGTARAMAYALPGDVAGMDPSASSLSVPDTGAGSGVATEWLTAKGREDIEVLAGNASGDSRELTLDGCCNDTASAPNLAGSGPVTTLHDDAGFARPRAFTFDLTGPEPVGRDLTRDMLPVKAPSDGSETSFVFFLATGVAVLTFLRRRILNDRGELFAARVGRGHSPHFNTHG